MGGASRSDSCQRHDAWTTHRGARAANSARARAQQYEIRGHHPAFSRTTAERDPMDGWSGIRHSMSCATRTDLHVSGQWQSVIVLLSLVGVLFVTHCPVLQGQTFTYQVNDSLWLFFLPVFHWLECCSSHSVLCYQDKASRIRLLTFCDCFPFLSCCSSLGVLCYQDRLSRIRSMTFCDCSSSCLSLVGVLFVTQCPVLPDRPSRIRSLTFCDCSSFLSFIGWSAVHHSVSCAIRTDFHVSGHWHSVIVLPSCPVVRHTVSCATRTKLHVAGQWQSVIFTPLCLLLVRV